MRNPTTTKLEIDVMQMSELSEAIDLSIQYHMPALVVHPDLAAEANLGRGMRQGRFKIIVPVDWPKGDKFGMAKMQGMRIEALSQDGFEIIVSNKKNASDIKNELLAIDKFIRNQLPPHIEIRVVLETFTRELDEIARICDVLREVPAPSYVRVDHHIRIQQAKANAKKHKDLVDFVREHTAIPIKLSGNLNTLKIVQSCDPARYAVGLKEAKSIIKEVRIAAVQPAS